MLVPGRGRCDLTAIDPEADVIVACLPDGRHRIIRGTAMLERIIASRRAEQACVQFVPVGSQDEADELIRRHGTN